MRTMWVLLGAVSLTVGLPAPGMAGAEPGAAVALTNISHSIEGKTLIVSGWVENRGMHPAGGLVIDGTGFSPSGEPTAFGSDGIPWQIAPGQSEHFSVRLSIDGQLIREYAVQVAFVRALTRPLAGLRRSVEFGLYRSLLLSMTQVEGSIRAGILTVRSDVRRLPVTRVTAEATVLLTHLVGRHVEASRLETITLDVPADGSVTIGLGVNHAVLLALRVVDVQARVLW